LLNTLAKHLKCPQELPGAPQSKFATTATTSSRNTNKEVIINCDVLMERLSTNGGGNPI
jgi:hypothetical protein